ncbi:MAG: hypothetical protein ACTSVA_06405 [Candidatus Njordarchaeales archaeon]
MAHEPKEIVPDEVFINDAYRIVNEAQKKGIIIRVIGAVAIRIHSKDFEELHKRLGRLGEGKQNFSDIDFVGYSKQKKLIEKFFEKDIGFIPDKRINILFGHKRLIFYHPKNWYHSDIFFDALEFSHDIFFGKAPGKGRLELDSPTIPLSDLVLEKLQIHEINEKDIKDLIVLFRAHDIGETDEREVINAKYIAKILADDWGFWYDATTNLKKVKLFAKRYLEDNKIGQEDYDDVVKKIDLLLDYIDKEPKTKRWKKRAKIGTKKMWWRPVEEVIR